MPTPAEPLPELTVADAADWRKWLGKHHADSNGVRLVLGKKGPPGPTSLTYQLALLEALSYGWIDGQGNRRDDATYLVRFTPRRKRSVWSKRNTEIAERLVEEGRMHSAGLAEIDRAKADGRWDAAYAGSKDIEVPDDLTAALNNVPAAKAKFDTLSALNRYAVLYRIHNAKRPETRVRRIEQFVAMLARGETVYAQRADQPGPDS
ncbi:MAG TPA: YdeI/OmpD-associated family protein [Candidatus Dormibacteraeota bacterium]|jgi:uncharacterized protein YdeI (YjbR/CyaY-like superfamily)